MLKPTLFLAVVTLSAGIGAGRSVAQPPTPAPTRDFVNAAAQSDQFEILEGRVAAVQSENARVRAFAQRMIQDHSLTTQALQQAMMRSGIAPPPRGLGGDQQRMLSALQSLSGPDFDRAYARQQVLAHDQALVVEQGYASGGSDPAIRQAARSAIPIIQHHLEMAQQMRATLGGS